MTSLTERQIIMDTVVMLHEQDEMQDVAFCKLRDLLHGFALTKAEAAVVGDWEAEFDTKFNNPDSLDSSTPINPVYLNGRIGYLLEDVKDFITTLLAAKDSDSEAGAIWDMEILYDKYGDRLRYIKHHPTNPTETWVLGIRGESTEVDGRLMKAKDIKIYATTFEGLLV